MSALMTNGRLLMDITMGYEEVDDDLAVAVRQFLADDEPIPSFVETKEDLVEWVADLYGLAVDDWIDKEGEVFLP